MILRDADGKARVLIAVKDKTPLFSLEEEDGTNLSLAGYGVGIQEGKKVRAALWLEKNAPKLFFWDKDEKVIWKAP